MVNNLFLFNCTIVVWGLRDEAKAEYQNPHNKFTSYVHINVGDKLSVYNLDYLTTTRCNNVITVVYCPHVNAYSIIAIKI